MALPGPLSIIGKRHVEVFTKWIPSMAAYGTAGTMTMLYFTDWKLVLQYVPFYNGKFKE